MLLILAFLLLLVIGVPVAFVLIGTVIIYFFFFSPAPLMLIPQRMFGGADQFVLLAIPFFILAGQLMNQGGMTKRLVRFTAYLVGGVSGGLAQVNVVVSMLFAGITGAAVADTSAIGSILIPAMVEDGYEADFSAAVTAASSTVGPIIPPSIPMVIFGFISGTSIGALFLAGAIPGILLGISQIILVYTISKKMGYKSSTVLTRSWSDFLVVARDALLALVMPAIILGGVLTGIFTATEAGAAAALYAFIIGAFVYRKIQLQDLPDLLLKTAVTTGVVMIIVSMAAPFAWVMAAERIPARVAMTILSLTENSIIILLLINVFLLFMGTFMETTANLIILTPVLLPLTRAIGIDPVHFGAIMVLNLVIGLMTPPVGVCLFVASSISRVKLEGIVKRIWPFLVAAIVVLLIVTYVEPVSTWLPRLILGR